MPTCGRPAWSAVAARSRATPPPFVTGYVASTIVQPFSCGQATTRRPFGAATVVAGARSAEVAVIVRGTLLVAPPVAAIAAAPPPAASASAPSAGQIQSPG